MFQSLNLFKSLNCPFYSQANNTLTCERPHCQFKHPNKILYTSVGLPKQNLSSNPPMPPENSIQPVEIVKPDEASNISQLPSMLENLTNALQTVQQLISSSNLGENLNKLASASSSSESSQISTTLESLNNALMSMSSNKIVLDNKNAQTPSKKADNPGVNSLKRQQLMAPAYNPTPIMELKKIKQEFVEDEVTATKRRKKTSESSEDTEDIVEIAKPSTINKHEHKKPIKSEPTSSITKSNPTSTNPAKKVAEVKSESSTKTDLVSFAKLPLSQQVLKRYEMLNKTPPTKAAIGEAKLKKIQGNMSGNSGSQASKSQDNLLTPRLIIDSSSTANKVPLVMRQRYLKVIFENGRLSFASLEKACEKAAEQEKSIYDRSKNKTIYTNLVANLIRGLRNSQQAVAKPDTITTKTLLPTHNVHQTVQIASSYSHEAMLSGPKANRVSYSINRVKQIEFKDLSEHNLYKIFCTYILTATQLDENSFPKWMSDSDSIRHACIPNYEIKNPTNKLEEAKKAKEKKLTSAMSKEELSESILTKLCKRCNRNFYLASNDLIYLSSNSECTFHWGKLRNVRVNKSIEHKYSCCNGNSNEAGCEVGKHVYDGDYDGNSTGRNMTGYVETKEPSIKEDAMKRHTSENIYALDCEMCYTARGLELTRVSIVDIHLNEVYESLVKPNTQVLDYNTRWSGLTEKSLKHCSKTLRQVQADLMKLFNKDTILLGHSLDSDFKALKLIHKKVIDTSVVFPHKMGPPYKRALRNLMSEHLQKIIQEDAEGHDSKEDANSCVQLMIWKINEDLKNSKKLATLLNTPPTTTTTSTQETAVIKSNVSSSSSKITAKQPTIASLSKIC